MRALGGVTISPSVKRYIYLVDGKKSPLLLLKRVKTKGGERRSNSLLRDNKNESESLDYLYEYTLHFGFDLRVARSKDAARIYFFLHTYTYTHLYAGPTISDALRQPDRERIERNRRRR